MLKVERKWNLTKYKIITREDRKKRKNKEKMTFNIIFKMIFLS